jgi:hypothetical protein
MVRTLLSADPLELPATAAPTPRAAAAPLSLCSPVEAYPSMFERCCGWRIEQGYQQVKGELGWADFQVRSDAAIQRHWQLVCCAFTFCWWAWCHAESSEGLGLPPEDAAGSLAATAPAAPVAAGRGENQRPTAGRRRRARGPGALARDDAPGPGVAGPVALPPAVLARLVLTAAAGGTPGLARRRRRRTAALPLPPRITNYG